jgi:hypothetical protein
MNTPASLRLLAATNNARGDLFTRLKKDLFFALGYTDLQFDVHKPGRELDILGIHCLEQRRLVVECKAHVKKMGGDAINKFRGAVAAERKACRPVPVAPYFVSLGGFTDDAYEQEKTMGSEAVILLDASDVIEKLQTRRVITSQTEAVERAGRCAAHAGLNDAVLDGAELLGHELGYLWAVFYSRGKERTHFALIHADGTPLAAAVAREVIKADEECDGSLNALVYLAPPSPGPDRAALERAALERYRKWLVTECGEIRLEGLPADSDLSTKRMELERLFVPIKVVVRSKLSFVPKVVIRSKPSEETIIQPEKVRESIIPVGEFLAGHPRFSLLAKPGGGKSTLLKRLAVAYAMPERRAATDDELRERDWLPLFLRCRGLRDRAHRPIRELLEDLPKHAGMNDEESSLFRAHMDEALRSGRAILLIDGLDEISEEGARTAFAGHLRTLLAMFPHVAMVVTSREAGYRHVAGVVASACEQVTLAPFDELDVQRLCESWHVEVVGDSKEIRSQARDLAATIWNNERIRALAENPLMLTTLLVVRRCAGGELPTRRVELYHEAVRVLIRTWNTEGFEPMDLKETLAQLSYVACTMLNEGIQQVGSRRLLKLLEDARKELQAELQFTRISAENFVERIEYRSSLLMQTGHERIDGESQAVYEFRHLTFQEYLAARGLVEEQYPGRDGGQSLVELLEPHFPDERWREVIALASVLAGRKAEPLIKRLTTLCDQRSLAGGLAEWSFVRELSAVLLRQCLLDEVQVTPPTLRAALRTMARYGNESYVKGSVVNLRRGKFGELFQEVADEAYFRGGWGWEAYFGAVSDLSLESFFPNGQRVFSHGLAEALGRSLGSGNRIEQTRAALVCGFLPYHDLGTKHDQDAWAVELRTLRDAVGRLLPLENPGLALAAAHALGLMGLARLPAAPPSPDVIGLLFHLWRESDSPRLREFARAALSAQPLHTRDAIAPETWGDCDTWLKNATGPDDSFAALIVAWYRRRPWSDAELAEMICRINLHSGFRVNARQMLATLGAEGRRVLKEWDAQERHRK